MGRVGCVLDAVEGEERQKELKERQEARDVKMRRMEEEVREREIEGEGEGEEERGRKENVVSPPIFLTGPALSIPLNCSSRRLRS